MKKLSRRTWLLVVAGVFALCLIVGGVVGLNYDSGSSTRPSSGLSPGLGSIRLGSSEDRIEREIRLLRQEFAEVTSELKQLTWDLSDMDYRLGGIETALDNIETALDKMERQMGEIEHELWEIKLELKY